MRGCSTCAYCDWRGQYCAKRDMDMSRSFMMKNSGCRDYSNHNDDEI